MFNMNSFQSQMQTFTVDFSLYKISTICHPGTHTVFKNPTTHIQTLKERKTFFTQSVIDRVKSAGDSCALSISFNWGKFFSAECIWIQEPQLINNPNSTIQWRIYAFLMYRNKSITLHIIHLLFLSECPSPLCRLYSRWPKKRIIPLISVALPHEISTYSDKYLKTWQFCLLNRNKSLYLLLHLTFGSRWTNLFQNLSSAVVWASLCRQVLLMDRNMAWPVK